MTDPSTPSTPEPNSTPPASSTPPAYTPSTGAAGAPGAKKGLSIAGFVLGLVAFVFSWIPAIGIIAGVVGLILSILARSKEPAAPNWMKIIGIIASIIGIVVSIIWIIVTVAILGQAASTGDLN